MIKIINIEKFVPKEWTIEKVEDNKIKVYYVNKGRGNCPKPFILPKIIEVDEQFMEAIGMYMGDGKLSTDDKHLGFSSIDGDMVRFILYFFTKRFNISLNDMTISIRFKKFNKEVLENRAHDLNVPCSKLKVQLTQRSRKESCEFEISGKVFRIIFENILNKMKSTDFVKHKKLRRAFLRGLFAAEGGIAINDIRNYIVYIQYCLGYHEDDLALLIKRALKIEGITYTKYKKLSDNSLGIRITSWQNYYKLWKMDLFRLSLRKEFRFLSKLKLTRFSCKITDNLKNRLFFIRHFSHRQLAFLIGTHPALFCNTLKNKTAFINIEYLINLAKIASVPLQEVKKNIVEFRVNDITKITDKEFIDFIFDLKNFAT